MCLLRPLQDGVIRICHECGVSETPKWRRGMTLCNACGLLAAKRDKNDKNAGAEDAADAESQVAAAQQAAHTAAQAAARASARAALSAVRAVGCSSSKPMTVHPSIMLAVPRAAQSEPSCALPSSKQQLTDGSDRDATPSASPLVAVSQASLPTRVHVSGPTRLSKPATATKSLVSRVVETYEQLLRAPTAVTFAVPVTSVYGATMQAGLAVQGTVASVSEAPSIVRVASGVRAKSANCERHGKEKITK